jgi:hypothetical protein
MIISIILGIYSEMQFGLLKEESDEVAPKESEMYVNSIQLM